MMNSWEQNIPFERLVKFPHCSSTKTCPIDHDKLAAIACLVPARIYPQENNEQGKRNKILQNINRRESTKRIVFSFTNRLEKNCNFSYTFV